MCLHNIFHVSERIIIIIIIIIITTIIIIRKRCSPIHSILEISDGMDIRCLKTTQYMKYLVDSFHVWFSVPSNR